MTDPVTSVEDATHENQAVADGREAQHDNAHNVKDKEREEHVSRSKSRERRRNRSRERHRRRHHDRSRSRERRRRRSRSRDSYERRRRRSRDRYHRRRSPSTERDRYGGRSRAYRGTSRISDRDKMAAVEDPFAQLRSSRTAVADPAEVQRQMQEQQLRARQLVLQQQAQSAMVAASKTQREVYVGGLVPGAVTENMIRDLFNATLSTAFPEKCKGIDPVLRITMSGDGKYCFLELLSPDMTNACLQLSGQIPLMGSNLAIGRPSGYVDPLKAQRAANVAANALAQFQADSRAQRLASGAVTQAELDKEETSFLCVEGVVTADVLEHDDEYNDVLRDVHEEFEKHGSILRVVIPRPTDPSQSSKLLGTESYGKAFVQYLDTESSIKAKDAIDGRFFAGQQLRVSCMSPQAFLDAIQPSVGMATDNGGAAATTEDMPTAS